MFWSFSRVCSHWNARAESEDEDDVGRWIVVECDRKRFSDRVGIDEGKGRKVRRGREEIRCCFEIEFWEGVWKLSGKVKGIRRKWVWVTQRTQSSALKEECIYMEWRDGTRVNEPGRASTGKWQDTVCMSTLKQAKRRIEPSLNCSNWSVAKLKDARNNQFVVHPLKRERERENAI
jgi:hypothetical protein